MLFEYFNDQEPSASSSIPASVREYASKHKLGRPLLVYPHKRIEIAWLIANSIASIFILSVVILAFYSNIELIVYGMPIFSSNSCINFGYAICGAIYFIVHFLYLLRLYITYRESFYLCQNGILRLDGKRDEAIRWEEVTDMYGSSDRVLALQKAGQKKFVLAQSWTCDTSISKNISRNLTERLWPQALERFEAGIPLSFGTREINREKLEIFRKHSAKHPLWSQALERFETETTLAFSTFIINYQGIRHEGELLAWNEIDDIYERKGWLYIISKGKRHGWESLGKQQKYNLSNLPLIVALTKHAIRSCLVATLQARSASLEAEMPAWDEM